MKAFSPVPQRLTKLHKTGGKFLQGFILFLANRVSPSALDVGAPYKYQIIGNFRSGSRVASSRATSRQGTGGGGVGGLGGRCQWWVL